MKRDFNGKRLRYDTRIALQHALCADGEMQRRCTGRYVLRLCCALGAFLGEATGQIFAMALLTGPKESSFGPYLAHLIKTVMGDKSSPFGQVIGSMYLLLSILGNAVRPYHFDSVAAVRLPSGSYIPQRRQANPMLCLPDCCHDRSMHFSHLLSFRYLSHQLQHPKLPSIHHPVHSVCIQITTSPQNHQLNTSVSSNSPYSPYSYHH